MIDVEGEHSFSRLSPVDFFLATIFFNERKKDYPSDLVQNLFELQVEKDPDATAITFLDQRLTYRELNAQSNQLAHFLIEQGITPNSFVGISLDRSLEMMIAVLATLKAGASYIPIEPSFPQDLVEFMVNDSLPLAVITTSDFEDKFVKSGVKRILLDDEAEIIAARTVEKPEIELEDSNIAYAIYTSGSTGNRKAALIEHRSIVNQSHAWHDAYQITAKDAVLQTASFSFDVFTGDWVRALSSGATLVMNPYNLILSQDDDQTGEKLYNLMRSNNVTVAEFTPPVLRKLIRYCRNHDQSLSFMRLIIVGADAWYMNEHRDLIEFTKGDSRVVDSYGMTEATVDSTYYEGYGREDESDITLIGKPFTNSEIYILDESGKVVSTGEKGELCVAGPGLARGYLNRPDLNKERFGEIIFPDGSRKRVYKSGDLARFRPDGNLEFFGRKDNQVELGAIRVELGEIESVIQKHPAVQENMTLIFEDANHDKKVICFVVLNPNQTFSRSIMEEFLTEKLPRYMWPSELRIVEKMPLTSAGKIDRKTLLSCALK